MLRTSAAATFVALVAAAAADAAPRQLMERDSEVARLIQLHRRQVGDSPIGAGVIIAIIVVGLVGLVVGLTLVYLRNDRKRQAKCRKLCCPCLPPMKEEDATFKNAPVYNGYGELINPNQTAAAPKWQVEQNATAKMSAAEAIALMEQQAKTGQVQAVVPGIEVPSVVALEQTTGFSNASASGTKVAIDNAVAAVEAESNEAADDLSAAVAAAADSVVATSSTVADDAEKKL